jgi:hypothetical protein
VIDRQMSSFRQHAGWCRRGWPDGGRERLDIFPEYGDAFPVWRKGVGVGVVARLPTTAPVPVLKPVPSPISPTLTDGLQRWNDDWERRAASGQDVTDSGWREGWIVEGQRLAAQLAAETETNVVR